MEDFECISQGYPSKEIHGLVRTRFEKDGVETTLRTDLLRCECLVCGRVWRQLLSKNNGYNMDESWLLIKPRQVQVKEG